MSGRRWVAEMLRQVVWSFDRAACSACSRVMIRYVVVDEGGAVEWLCDGCPPCGVQRCDCPGGHRPVIDLVHEQAVTVTELEQRAERYWRTRQHRAAYRGIRARARGQRRALRAAQHGRLR